MSTIKMELSLTDKINEALSWLQKINAEVPEGFTVAFSGGKDSLVAYDLSKKAKIKINNVRFALSGVDPPEVISYIKTYFPEVEFVKPKYFMAELIARQTVPPTRKYRYCCRFLHMTFHGHIITGIRREESNARKNYERIIRNKRWKTHILYLPILDWTVKDVWNYIFLNRLPYCSLYGKCLTGRVGCLGCPLKTLDQRWKDFENYHWLKDYYVSAFDKMLKNGKKNYTWKNGEEVFNWWMSRR